MERLGSMGERQRPPDCVVKFEIIDMVEVI
jgi:hypothetical protein